MTQTRNWTMPEIAAEVGVALSTIQAYRSRKQMPEPSGAIGRTPYWTEAAIGDWLEERKQRRTLRR